MDGASPRLGRGRFDPTFSPWRCLARSVSLTIIAVAQHVEKTAPTISKLAPPVLAESTVKDRVVRFYEAPIGKKAMMAVTGILLFGYVAAHLLGNLQIFLANPDQINLYAAFLHNPSNAALLWIARLVLLAAVVLHIIASVQLWNLKRAARPVRYVK